MANRLNVLISLLSFVLLVDCNSLRSLYVVHRHGDREYLFGSFSNLEMIQNSFESVYSVRNTHNISKMFAHDRYAHLNVQERPTCRRVQLAGRLRAADDEWQAKNVQHWPVRAKQVRQLPERQHTRGGRQEQRCGALHRKHPVGSEWRLQTDRKMGLGFERAMAATTCPHLSDFH